MYTGFNAKKERKQTKVEKLQAEIKRLHKALGAMIHIHERLKNERTQSGEVAKLPALSTEATNDSAAIEKPHTSMSDGKIK
jgi:hypothetical protein